MNTSKLIDKISVTIDKEVVAMAVRLSIKSSRPAYTLTMKLMPELFTNEEISQSRGQGLLAKKDDLRTVLDKEKISTMKEYVRYWCKTNNLKAPGDTEINEAVTESYLCKKVGLKKSALIPMNGLFLCSVIFLLIS
ncbi:hypothetical protein ACJMK2_017346 [Sinanodonta woodiana]|uniref:BEN domain-containing protein n=1 Tax=Sinanodonta woodiana TaxID=1069815 RepID=A0ABD3UYQ0_SINWO